MPIPRWRFQRAILSVGGVYAHDVSTVEVVQHNSARAVNEELPRLEIEVKASGDFV